MADQEAEGLLLIGLAGTQGPASNGGSVWGSSDGEGGIISVTRDPLSGRLGELRQFVPSSGVSFMATSPDRACVYAVGPGDEAADRVTSFALSKQSGLVLLNQQSTAGIEACYVSVHPGGRHVMTANFRSGSFVVHPIGSDGRLEPPSQVLRRSGSGPRLGQESSHPHMIEASPDGSWIVGVDLGTDEVIAFESGLTTEELVLQRNTAVKVHSGAGPRHAAFGSSGQVFVVNELDSTITSLTYDGESRVLNSLGYFSALIEGEGSAPNKCSAVRISADGRFLYVANRGRDTITVFEVTEGHLMPMQEAPCGGGPRDMIIVGGFIYVANKRSRDLTVLPRDGKTGRIGAPLQVVSLPMPMCVLAI